MNSNDNIALTAGIVGSFVGNNQVEPSVIPGLIRLVFESLSQIDALAQAPHSRPEPAVSVRASVSKEYMTCLECGGKFKLLKRHLGANHGMTPEAYRKRWDLPASYPMISPNYSVKRQEIAIDIGLGRTVDTAEPMPAKRAASR